MIRNYLVCTALAIVALSGPARASDKIAYAPAPSWVIARPAPSDTPAKDHGPVSILALDVQIRESGGAVSRFSHSMMRINTAQGLQLGTVSLSWLPDTQDLIVHKILIHRDGKIIDVLQQGQKLTVLRREQNLDQATLDGALTANLFPAGLQVGDVLELATTIVSRNPVLGTHKEAFFGPANFPADRVDFSLSWPADQRMRLAKSKEMPAWRRTSKDGFDTASLTLTNIQPIVPPSGAPLRYSILRIAEGTDFASWADVSHLFAPLYAKASRIPASGPLRDAVDAIRAKTSDPKARAEAALRLVQDQIRYVALEMGQGGLIPANAAETWQRRYGDCKGKTALLLGLLHELDIDAEPVAVNSVAGDMLSDRLPAVSLFDHILVRATIAGKTYWLDGTRTGDTDLDRIKVPDFEWGLPVGTGAADLVKIVPPPLAQPSDDLSIELDGRKGLFGPVPAHIVKILRGDSANGFHQALSGLTGDAREKALRDYWSNQFDFIKPTKTDFAFDPASGQGRVTLDGVATLEWTNGYYETDGTGVGYRADFSRMNGPFSDAPFKVDYPSYSRTRETILLPPDFPNGPIAASTNVDETVAGVTYKRQVTREGDRYVIVRSSRSIAPEFPASAAPAAQKRLRELNDATVYLRVPPGYKPSTGDMQTLTADDQSADKLMQNGNILLNSGKYADALAQFTRATEVAPDNQSAWASRGVTEAWLRQYAEASVSLDRAASKGPMTSQILDGRGLIAEFQGDFKTAITEYSAAIALQPDDVFALTHRGAAKVSTSDWSGGNSDADKAIATAPKASAAYWIKFRAELGMGDRAAAKGVIDAMLAAISDDPQAKMTAALMYQQLGDKQKATAMLGDLGAAADSAQVALLRAELRGTADVSQKRGDLDKAVALAPTNAAPYMARATFRREHSDFTGALSDVDKAISINPKDGDAYLLKANILSSMGRRDAVIDVAKQVAAAIPDNGFGHVVAAKIYAHFDMRKPALAEIDKALRIAPEPYIYLNRADVMDPDDIPGRMAELDKALAMQPDMPAALAYKANLFRTIGDYPAALDIYNQLIAKNPNEAGSYYLGRGIARWKTGDKAGATADFKSAETAAKTPFDLNNICYELASGNIALDSALKLCNDALLQAPGNVAILDSRGFVYLRMGRYRDAIGDYDAVLSKSPHLSESLLGRAIAEARTGDMAKARDDFNEAKKQDPNVVSDFAKDGISIPPELIN